MRSRELKGAIAFIYTVRTQYFETSKTGFVCDTVMDWANAAWVGFRTEFELDVAAWPEELERVKDVKGRCMSHSMALMPRNTGWKGDIERLKKSGCIRADVSSLATKVSEGTGVDVGSGVSRG